MRGASVVPARVRAELGRWVGPRVRVLREMGQREGYRAAARKALAAVSRKSQSVSSMMPFLAKAATAVARGKKVVVAYCLYPSHFQNFGSLASRLSPAEFELFFLFAFSRETYDPPLPPHVHALFGDATSLRWMLPARVYVSPEVTPRPVAPIGSRRLHLLVSLAGLQGVYEDNHFDGYDYIACAGEYQVEDFSRLAQRHPLSGKTLIPMGYPKLDRDLGKFDAPRPIGSQPVVVYAPTHPYSANEQLTSLRGHGRVIIGGLLDQGFAVIFRPHPNSLVDGDAHLVQAIAREFKGNPSFALDTSKDYRMTYGRADLMVTDLSGTGFTFAFTYLRPAVFFAHNAEAETGLTGFHFEKREEVGGVARDLPSLLEQVRVNLARPEPRRQAIEALRGAAVFNLGGSEAKLAESIEALASGKRGSGWVTLGGR